MKYPGWRHPKVQFRERQGYALEGERHPALRVVPDPWLYVAAAESKLPMPDRPMIIRRTSLWLGASVVQNPP